MDFMVSSFRIMSPTSFVYGESVDASNFIQLDDLECHFQPLNVTLQVTTPGTISVIGTNGRAHGMYLLLKGTGGPGYFQKKVFPA